MTFNSEVWRVVMVADIVSSFWLVIETMPILDQVLCNQIFELASKAVPSL
ncbi:hypothetical protein SynA1528_00339 [Synechococcus sp. A15-28]|nr:hypothetical protein SynA1528_00339 [Synechococcus sp. A15-28]